MIKADILGVVIVQQVLIMLTNTNDVSMAFDAVKADAWDFFEKSTIQRVLLDSVQRAIRYSQFQCPPMRSEE